MTAQAPLDRLEPADFYRQLDWIRDEWETAFEDKMAQRLDRLERHFAHLPTRYYDESTPYLAKLGRDRLKRVTDYTWTIRQLADVVRKWDRARPPLLTCPDCGLEVRGHRTLATHRYVIHDVEDEA